MMAIVALQTDVEVLSSLHRHFTLIRNCSAFARIVVGPIFAADRAEDDARMANKMSVESKLELLVERIDHLSQKTDALAAKTDAIGAKTDAIGAKTDAIAAKTDAIAAKTDAIAAKVDALTATTSELTVKTAELAVTTRELTEKTGELFTRTDELTRTSESLSQRMDSLDQKMSVGFEESHRLLKISLEGLAAHRESTDRRFDQMADDHAKQFDLLTKFGIHIRRRVERLETPTPRRRR